MCDEMTLLCVVDVVFDTNRCTNHPISDTHTFSWVSCQSLLMTVEEPSL